ncbi:MAG: ABC transporter ATP-binding protein [Eubacteriales bacterium]|nr:ABC transporter ATP-binding protein [Eubacteriales bacterium]
MGKVKIKSYFLSTIIHFSGWFILELIMSYVLARVVVRGNTIIGSAIDRMLSSSDVDILSLMETMLLMTGLGFLLAFIKSFAASKFSVSVQTRYKSNVAKKLYSLEYKYFDVNGSASIINKMNSDIAEADTFLSELLPSMCTSFLTIIVYAVYIGTLNTGLLIIMIVLYPLVLLLSNAIARKVVALKQMHRVKADRVMDISQDSVSGILVLRAFGAEALFQRELDKAADEIVEYEAKRVRISNTAMIIRKMLQWLPNIICAVYAYILVCQGNLTIGKLMAFIVILSKFVENFIGLPFEMIEARECIVCIKRIETILAQKNEPSGTYAGSRCKDSERYAVEFENVNFSYTEDKEILHNISFKIEKGTTVAFVGDSGGGKSTIFHILCGFYPINAGTYRLFGTDFNNWDIEAARGQMALVSQNVFLFPASIRENVAYGNMSATEEEIIDACKKARIHDFIMSQPDGYDTLVGERGILLSGGERQRISIARAFLKDAPVLLLDEPTSAVDVGTEKMIQEAVNKLSLNRTCLIIAHRLSTIKNADTIFCLKDGCIVETGSHEQLIEKDGVYAGMYGKEEFQKKGDMV